MIDCLSNRADVDVPATPAVPAPAMVEVVPAVPHAVLGVAGKTVGTVGTGDVARALGNTPTVGIAGAELTPRLPISMAPNGIPVRVPPPVVGDMDVGVDDEAMLLDPEPHIPDDPDVSSIPDVADIPDVAVLPAAAAVAGAEVPAAVPPPS